MGVAVPEETGGGPVNPSTHCVHPIALAMRVSVFGETGGAGGDPPDAHESHYDIRDDFMHDGSITAGVIIAVGTNIWEYAMDYMAADADTIRGIIVAGIGCVLRLRLGFCQLCPKWHRPALLCVTVRCGMSAWACWYSSRLLKGSLGQAGGARGSAVARWIVQYV